MNTAALSPLTPLQCDVLAKFFDVEADFFLTGGAALSGFYLHHRSTTDLDLFTTSDDALARGRTTLPHIAAVLGCRFAWKHESPDFRRAVLSRENEALVVDLVRDRTPQTHPKVRHGDIVVDSIEELLANKLAALVGRQEERDLFDVYRLEQHGLRVQDALVVAEGKDGGATAATLAWLLKDFPLPASLVSAEERAAMAIWRDALVVRLRAGALPSGA
jgi:hypothetical protein